jgi:hypothetical protein
MIEILHEKLPAPSPIYRQYGPPDKITIAFAYGAWRMGEYSQMNAMMPNAMHGFWPCMGSGHAWVLAMHAHVLI